MPKRLILEKYNPLFMKKIPWVDLSIQYDIKVPIKILKSITRRL